MKNKKCLIVYEHTPVVGVLLDYTAVMMQALELLLLAKRHVLG